MNKRNHTKEIMAVALKKIVSRKALKSITIQDIVDECNINRHTFYYHFCDKQDLINWIYKNDVIDELAQYKNFHWSYKTLHILKCLQKDKKFYIQALNSKGQNCFADYLYEETYKLADTRTQEILGDQVMDGTLRNQISEFYAHAFTGTTINWVKKGMNISPEQLAAFLKIIADNKREDMINDNIINVKDEM